MPQNEPNQFVDFIDMRLNDPELEGWDGRSSRVEPGFYDFEVTDAQMGQSGKGNPTLVLTYRVISDGEMSGRTMRQSYAILPDNDGARRRMKNLIDALGAERDAEGRFSPAGLVGLQMHAEVITNTYDDIDPRSGQPVTKESSKLVGEEAIMAQQPVQPAVPQGRPVAQRRPGNNQGQPVRR
jgi:hypothetical protein